MRSIHLFDLASRNNQWLSMRQSVVAGNIANANTPGYHALELQPFEAVLESANLQMAVTERGHMAPDATAATPTNEVEGGRTWDAFRSGNNVNLEQEMIKAGDVNRAYSMNAGVMKAFHRMLLSSTRPGG